MRTVAWFRKAHSEFRSTTTSQHGLNQSSGALPRYFDHGLHPVCPFVSSSDSPHRAMIFWSQNGFRLRNWRFRLGHCVRTMPWRPIWRLSFGIFMRGLGQNFALALYGQLCLHSAVGGCIFWRLVGCRIATCFKNRNSRCFHPPWPRCLLGKCLK